MKYVSVCSGVEAATVAWHGLGWEPQWFSEIEKFPSAVLAHHYPDVQNYGDMTAFKGWPDDRSIDLLVGGTPCQSFSVAGLRRGLDDPRGNLMLTYLAIAAQYRPKWLVWENVPGVLSSNRGRDFGSFLGALGQCGYGFAYRMLDAQYFGVPQRRKRVFVVGHLGDWRRSAAVLFERESLSGHPAPSRKAREETAGTVTARSFDSGQGGQLSDNHLQPTWPAEIAGTVTTRAGNGGGGGLGTDEACSGFLQPTWPAEIASTLNAAFGEKQGLDYQHINSGAPLFVPDTVGSLCARTDRSMSVQDAEQAHLLPIAFGAQNSAAQGDSVSTEVTPAVEIQNATRGANQNGLGIKETDVMYTLDVVSQHAIAIPYSAVRRLTPVECERLQGFPDNYTQIEWRNKPAESCPDGPRYKAMGNSMAVPVMRWLGSRIEMVDKL